MCLMLSVFELFRILYVGFFFSVRFLHIASVFRREWIRVIHFHRLLCWWCAHGNGWERNRQIGACTSSRCGITTDEIDENICKYLRNAMLQIWYSYSNSMLMCVRLCGRGHGSAWWVFSFVWSLKSGSVCESVRVRTWRLEHLWRE